MTAMDELNTSIAELPVVAVLAQLQSALRQHRAAVLVAPPGAGKTTAVPLALLDADWLAGKSMLLLAPRRLAVRTAAQRMARLLGEAVGTTVGYRMRLESCVGPQTRITVVTEGVLTRMLQADPGLSGIGLVIFDEFHERSLDADLGLALCREVQTVFNESLRLLVMSATLDPAPVSALLGQAPLIRCEGRAFTVETRYLPPVSTKPIERAVADAIVRCAAAGEGNILAFLPGAAEIRRTARWLAASSLAPRWQVVSLYGNLSRLEQDAAIAPPPSGRGKVVLSTAIAETSLTIEGVKVVIDSGLQRAPRFDPRTAMTRLVTLPVSRASADQRCGRAGRLAPGICYRLWAQERQITLPVHNRPEILESDLAGLVLELALWGETDPERLAWLDPPPAAAWRQACSLLVELEAMDERGRITSQGRAMAQLPLHPRLAHMLLAARKQNLGGTACDLAAVLSERDPLRFSFGACDSDLRLRLEALDAFRGRRPWQLAEGTADKTVLRRILKVAALLRQRLRVKSGPVSTAAAGRLLAWAYPDRIALRRPGTASRYVMTNGGGACFGQPEPLGTEELLVIAALDGERREARIFAAAPYDRCTLEEQFGSRMRLQEEVTWDEQRQAVCAERRTLLGALVLHRESVANAEAQAVTSVMLAAIRREGIAILPWTPALRSLQARVLLLRRIMPDSEAWPDLSDAALAAELEVWLAPELAGISSLKALARLDLAKALRRLVPLHRQRLLDDLAPTHITVPSGRRHPIDYSGESPVLAVRLQEMFGAVETPTIAAGRRPVILHLLSPAGRPVQITRDLAGFWRNSYPSVKKELKGRYPKHHWPEDPLAAAPTVRAKSRKKKS